MELYQHWDVTSPEIPPRSLLYTLPPVGIGTADVESLTSYFVRLAQAHCVSPSLLVIEAEAYLDEAARSARRDKVHPAFAGVINGANGRTRNLVRAVEQQTSRSDIRYTTMLTYADVLSVHKLQRAKRAWCPACFNEWRHTGSIIYEPLLWAVTAVTVCSYHQQYLVDRCTLCSQQQPPLVSNMRPGYCSKCQSWLGADIDVSGDRFTSLSEVDLKKRLWITEVVGEMLATAPSLVDPPTTDQLISRLKLCIDQASYGRLNVFAVQVGMWYGTLRRLVANGHAPVLPVLLQICAYLDQPLVTLVTGTKELSISGANDPHGSLNHLQARRIQPSRMEPMSFNEIRLEMEKALAENPPPSMRQIQRRTGRHESSIKRRHPTLYDEIVKRYRDFHLPDAVTQVDAETALKAALKQNPPPSLQSIFRTLGCHNTGYRFYHRFPDLCKAVAARYKKHRNNLFNREAMRQALESALTEEPAPSLSELVRRLGHRRNFIKEKFPELTKAIVGRYLTKRRALRGQGLAQLRTEVEKAVCTLVAEGLNPSERRVQSHLSRHWHSTDFKRTLREVKLALGLMQ